MTLYELTADYANLLELAEDPDIDEQAFLDTLEGIEGAIEDKADGYARVIRQLTADAEALKAESDRLYNRRKNIENNIDRMKKALQNAMVITGKTKFKTDLFSFGIRKNVPAVVIDEQRLANIPAEFLIPQDPKIDKKAIKEAIKAGKNLDGIAHLEQSESLTIR